MFKSVQMFAEKNTNLRKTRDLLLPKLISGEIDVEDLPVAGIPDGLIEPEEKLPVGAGIPAHATASVHIEPIDHKALSMRSLWEQD